ncbi:chromosome segregation protein SMC [Paenibacillus rhizophilus]|uniref:Chromosome segregation protein SMC n=1 Tax=Paenibacillus rhizophilus TaxID=1850366 RepID=A0A3N9NWY1_9BACL|nr:chromosome segregation protein SMC [Paenibacillus rhizophilus]RQW08401.1 chromosome segregation protein SMC [Paenibacillus rhizophilus]
MNPWALEFSGIRDFTDTRLEWGGPEDHVLIGGPNGSGKSTITFCLGAVLASSKVDLEGLRSRNLPPDRMWRATIQLVFANTGARSVDAAPYIGFRLNLEQKPGDPLRKEYYICEGDEPWNWKEETRYTPGDETNHLHEYRHQLRHKYKVDPDAFYLIWYQQDVNQFAVMRPEERFRIFSEMTGIERIQHNWEKVKEDRKDALSALQTAESNQHSHKLNLGNWQQERDRLLSRNGRRRLGLGNVLTASAALERLYGKEQELLKERMDELEQRHEAERDRRMQLEEEHEGHRRELEERTRRMEELNRLIEELEGKAAEERALREQLNGEYRQLEDILKELDKEIRAIPYSKAEVDARLEQGRTELREKEAKGRETDEAYQEAQTHLDWLAEEIGELNYTLEEDFRRLGDAKKMLAQYGGSAALERETDSLEIRRSSLRDSERELERSIQSLTDELESLTKSNGMYSLRQEASIRRLRGRGIAVYTLRDLLEMDEQIPLEREEQLESIKYTLFVDAKGFAPPTDIYHVELPAVVPERTANELPYLGLRVRKELDDQTYAAAQKALWWVGMIASGSSKPRLENGQLVDSLGRRGPQEERRWILNPRGIKLRAKRAAEELEKLELQLEAARHDLSECEERLGLVRSVHQLIKEAEAVVGAVAERDLRKRELDRKTGERKKWTEIRNNAGDERQRQIREGAELAFRLEALEGYRQIYERADLESMKIERFGQLGQELEASGERIQRLERELQDRLEEADRLDRSLESARRRIREKLQYIEESNKTLEVLDGERREMLERLEVTQENRAAERQFYGDWTVRLSAVYTGLLEESPEFPVVPDWTPAQAKSHKEDAFVQLNHALNEIVDENAVENYEKVKLEFERGEQEVQDARTLLRQLEESLAELEEKLVSTTNYEIKRVSSRFARYMDLFSFDGEVSWDMQEMKQGNIKYYLNIRARKQGHRGPLEEIGMKGRGGRVGKGVSGGEESLSSLLFALALLKTIQAEPGYIVLDEFDSALDEGRKSKVFELYERELSRKMIILSPKSHESDYLRHFNEAFIVYHDARIPKSAVIRIRKKAGIKV